MLRPTSNEPQSLAESVFFRVARRQEASAQARFIEAMQLSPLKGRAVLCGSAALHGVYLGARRSPTLDLLIPPLWAVRFPALMDGANVSVSPCPIRNKYVLEEGKPSIPGLNVWIHLRPTHSMPECVEKQAYCGSSGSQAIIETIPIFGVALEKLRVLSSRYIPANYPADYLDAWLILKRKPEIAAQVIEYMEAQGRNHSDAGEVIDIARALRGIKHIALQDWQAVSRLIWPLPPLDQVAEDLRDWWKPLISRGTEA